jgi:hypothetical protein
MAPCLLLLCALAGCDTARSISNSGFPDARGAPNLAYRGELSEFDLLGITAVEPITDAEIATELAEAERVTPQIGKPILAVQSGALAPDAPMLSVLAESFPVAGFSGVPPQDRAGFSRQLRLAAARGGIPQILCYWGVLETAKTNEATKLVSWVPIVGAILPDQSQHMRIRLKAILMDVSTGRWRMVSAEPAEDDSLSAALNRRSSDQGQVEELKSEGYRRLARQLVALG